MRSPLRRCVGGLLAAASLLLGTPSALAAAYGLQFTCPRAQHESLAADMRIYLSELGIAPALYGVHRAEGGDALRYSLNTPPGDTGTLNFHERPEFAIPMHIDWVTTASGELRNVLTVTEKEIVLALMQRGRLTEFSGRACTVDALREHVGLRKNIVSWAERLEWGWPDGRKAEWNLRYWDAGDLNPGIGLWPAIQDAFFNQEKYKIGCYTAAKLIVVQGTLDYFHRVRQLPEMARLIEERLLADGAPLTDLEPARMWSFESDYDPREARRPGKLLRVFHGIARDNFVPGDWAYFLNTDPVSYAETGYEGSNPIYLGRNRFADYYNDHDHDYSFQEKLDEVYQWRHGVYDRVRDAEKVVPLGPADYDRLSRTPAEGGLLLPLRTTPYYFGYEDLPPLPAR